MDLGHLDIDFVIVIPHMIPFWSPWDHGSAQENVSRIFGCLQYDQEGPECQTKMWILEDLGNLEGDFVIVTLHIHFWNPRDHKSDLLVFPGIF